MIKAITFDFWQTLYQGQKVDYAERLRQLKAKVERGQATTFRSNNFKTPYWSPETPGPEPGRRTIAPSARLNG